MVIYNYMVIIPLVDETIFYCIIKILRRTKVERQIFNLECKILFFFIFLFKKITPTFPVWSLFWFLYF